MRGVDQLKKPIHVIARFIYHLLVLFVLLFCTNSVFLLASGASDSIVMLLFILLTFFFWIWPAVYGRDIVESRVRQLWYGNIQLRIFLEALVITVAYTLIEVLVLHKVDDGVSRTVLGFEITASWSRMISHTMVPRCSLIRIASILIALFWRLSFIRDCCELKERQYSKNRRKISLSKSQRSIQ